MTSHPSPTVNTPGNSAAGALLPTPVGEGIPIPGLLRQLADLLVYTEEPGDYFAVARELHRIADLLGEPT